VVKPVIRSKSVGTKVTEEEYARLEALAGGRPMGEWVREVLLAADSEGAPTRADEAVMAELLALRSLTLTLFFRVANGDKIDEAEMRTLIERADGDKRKKAMERLSNR
jgi:hypothetical protein